MLSYRIPPKPGEVSLDGQQAIDLLFLRGHTSDTARESLLAGAGFVIGSTLANECETLDDARAITDEIVDQSTEAFKEYNSRPQVYDSRTLKAERLAAALGFGMRQGHIVTVEQTKEV
jgi:hypothetical protein